MPPWPKGLPGTFQRAPRLVPKRAWMKSVLNCSTLT